jgi:RNA polymerase sigma-70 factor (ECF subfamily)
MRRSVVLVAAVRGALTGLGSGIRASPRRCHGLRLVWSIRAESAPGIHKIWDETVENGRRGFPEKVRQIGGRVASFPMETMSESQAHHAEFLRLYAENEAALHAFVRSMLPSRQEASEVMQDVVVTLWQKFESAHNFRPWAYAVARSKVLMHLRRRARDRHVFDEELVGQLADRQDAFTHRHELQREALEECLQKLPQDQRDMVLSAYTKNTRIHAMAQSREETAMALYKRLHRIRQVLLECVQRTLNREELA